jgi:hypothetical protein
MNCFLFGNCRIDVFELIYVFLNITIYKGFGIIICISIYNITYTIFYSNETFLIGVTLPFL